jgi:hypothetical protein
MSFIINNFNIDDFEKIGESYRKYLEYLRSLKDRIPPNAYIFATADWHYNPKDHRAPHDSWLKSFIIDEQSTGERSEKRWVNIIIRLLGAYHDGTIEINYKSVSSYSLKKTSKDNLLDSNQNELGHGDWLIDEIMLSDRGDVIHEIIFSSNCQWTIECKDIIYSWKPFEEDN